MLGKKITKKKALKTFLKYSYTMLKKTMHF